MKNEKRKATSNTPPCNLLEFKKGFTLFEFLVYSAIGSIIVVLGTQISLNVFFSTAKAEQVSEIEHNASFALETISHMLRNGRSVITPAVDQDATTLGIRRPNLTLPTVFTVSGGRMYMREGSGPNVPITSSTVVVSNILFQNIQVSGSPSAVRASFTISGANPSNLRELNYSENFSITAAVRMRP